MLASSFADTLDASPSRLPLPPTGPPEADMGGEWGPCGNVTALSNMNCILHCVMNTQCTEGLLPFNGR